MPFEPVVAVWVVVPPLGVLSVNVTLAPEAGVPPFVTEAAIGTLPGGAKLVAGTARLATSEGGVITVAFAAADAVSELFEALMFTAYVPGGVPDGAPLLIVTEADCPGPSVTEDEDREVVHPDGSVEPNVIVLEGHDDESLFVTETE